MARSTKRTDDVVKKLIDAIRLGATYQHACNYAGISVDSFDRWRKAHADFAAQVKEAEGQATVQWLAKIEKAASDGIWQAAAWKLERRYPQDYGRTVQEHQGKDGGPLVFTIALDKPGDDDSE